MRDEADKDDDSGTSAPGDAEAEDGANQRTADEAPPTTPPASGTNGCGTALEPVRVTDKQDQQQTSQEWFSKRFLSDDELNDLMREIGIEIDGLPVDDHGNAQRLLNLSEGKLLLVQSKKDLTWAAFVVSDDPDRPTKWSMFLGTSHAGQSVVKVGNLLLKWAGELRQAIGIKSVEARSLNGEIQKLKAGDAKRKALEARQDDVQRQIERMKLAFDKVTRAGNRLRHVAGVNAVRSMAANVPAFIVPASSFDRDPDHIVAINCIIHLRTGEEIPFDPKFRLTRSLTCSYVPGAKAPRFEQFLREVFPGQHGVPDQDLIDFVQEVAGTFLTGRTTEQKAFIFYGDTNSGKSTLLDVLRAVLGEAADEGYAASAPFGLLRESSRSWHSTAALVGMRLVVDSEFDEDDTLNVDSLKRTTGERHLPSDGKYEKVGDFLNTAKVAAVTNFLPTNAESDEADIDESVLRRFIPIPMNARIVRKDLKLGDLLVADERIGVLAWMVEGARRWYARGHLVLPQAVLDAQREFRDSLGMALDPIEQALRDAGYVWPDPNVFTSSTDLTAAVNDQLGKRNEAKVDIKIVTAWCDAVPGLKKDRPREFGRRTGYWGIGK